MAQAATRIRIMPPDGAVLAAGQLVDIRVEATAEGAQAPRDLIVTINGTDVTNRNMVAPTEQAPPTSTNFMLRGFSMTRPGTLLIEARTADGASASARLTVAAWDGGAATRAKNIIVLVGDGMGAAHRTAARLVSHGLKNGRAAGRLAMDDLEVTGMVMTASLNAAITDSSPGMSAYVTGQKMGFAKVTNADADPTNDTLVIVTADHETGGMAVVGIGNERYAPQTVGKAVRDYAAVLRFEREQQLELTPNYVVDERGFPVDPDPSRKILLGWAAGADHYENWLGNRRQMEATIARDGKGPATADPSRDGPADRVPGFLVQGVIENGATPCPAADGCPADTESVPHTISGHTASDVPLSATGPGALQFTGVFENTDVFLKLLRATSGTYQR